MKNAKRALALAVMAGLMLPLMAHAQTPERGNVALLLDLSGSMNAELEGKTRRDVAVESLKSSVAEIGDKANLGLYAFGTNFDNKPANKSKSCEDIQQLVDFGKNKSGEINEVLSGLEAKGWTPLAKSIATIGADLAQYGDSEHHLIILSDGEESCGGDPIAEVEKLKANGVNVIINTIGLAVDANTKAQLEGIAAAGGGEYFDAADSGALNESLKKAVTTVKLEEQGEVDFSGDATFKLGGESFDDAVQLTLEDLDSEKTYNFPKNLAGTFLTYKLPKELEPGDKLTVGNIFTQYIDVYEDGSIQKRDTDTYVDVVIFGKRKGRLFEARNEGYEFDTSELTIELTEELLDNSFLFIGQKEYNISKDTKIYFEIEKGSAESKEDTDGEGTSNELESGDSENLNIAELSELLNTEDTDMLSVMEALAEGSDLGSLTDILTQADEDIKKNIKENKKELMKSEQGRALLKAFGEDVEESFLDKETFGVKNLYLAGGAAGVIVLLLLAVVGLRRKK